MKDEEFWRENLEKEKKKTEEEERGRRLPPAEILVSQGRRFPEAAVAPATSKTATATQLSIGSDAQPPQQKNQHKQQQQQQQQQEPQPTTVEMPHLGATFVPGGFDDYQMPEVFAPSPQRVMPEVPQNMQQDLQRLEQTSAELDATERSAGAASTNTTTAANRNGADTPTTQAQLPRIQEPPAAEFKPFEDSRSTPFDKMLGQGETFDAPSFSPFPKVKGDNIPMSDEEKEEILYNARQHVLHSNNVAMQLSWARDSLAWVDIAAEAWQRENPGVDRPTTPKVEHELRNDAVNIVSYLSEQGHPEALFMRAKWLEFGKFGQRADKREAFLGYRKAAEQGWGRAEYRMGMLYENSNDMEKAIKHYTNGMEQRDSAASYRLGMMSLLGQHGYPMDYRRGLDLIQVAADSADEDAPQGAYVYGMLIARDLPDLNIPEGLLPPNLGLARQYVE
ncbi:hypothetical protein MAPG_11509, partial [Magnaporthiopsis poae ATCC 64411]